MTLEKEPLYSHECATLTVTLTLNLNPTCRGGRGGRGRGRGGGGGGDRHNRARVYACKDVGVKMYAYMYACMYARGASSLRRLVCGSGGAEWKA